MGKIILFLLLPILLVSNEENNYKIAADKIDFKKNNLYFEKGFFLEHSFGNIYAKKAQFTNFKKGPLFDFHLYDGVKLTTNTHGILTSDEADFKCLSSKIKFYSKDLVNYKDTIKKKDLKIQSKKVECFLDTKKCIKNLKIQDVYSISFIDEVVLTLDNRLNIFTKKAVFEQNEASSNIFLYPEENKLCLFKYEDSEITSRFAKLDVNNLDLYLDHPKGSFNNFLHKKNNIEFSAKKMIWHNFENSLLLNEDVKVIDPQFGSINSEEVELIKQIKENIFHKIITRKNTIINFFSKTNPVLITKGIIELDHEKNQITAFNLKNEDQDIVYQDDTVYICSKKAKLKYNQDKKIDKITLNDNIKFIYVANKNNSGYGVADKIEYFPNEKIVKLISEQNKKVLFWQEDGSLHLSAKEIHINQKEKKDIKGIGDVRFKFNMEEENLIQDLFSKYMNL